MGSSILPSDPLTRGRLATHKGFPSVLFSSSQIETLSSIFPWALVGKFAKGYNKENPDLGRPPVDFLHKFFEAMDLKGDFRLGLLDNRHLLIRLSHPEDYLRLYSRPVWHVKGMSIRIFKWTNKFHVERESSVVPVWITLSRLPIHFFAHDALFSIASAIGNPLRLDAATQCLKRPSMARVQVELDVLKDRPNKLWIGCDDGEGFWQKIEYDDIPAYCQHCWHIGHSENQCHIQNPELKQLEKSKELLPKQRQQNRVYVQKQQQPTVALSKENVDEPNVDISKGKTPASSAMDTPSLSTQEAINHDSQALVASHVDKQLAVKNAVSTLDVDCHTSDLNATRDATLHLVEKHLEIGESSGTAPVPEVEISPPILATPVPNLANPNPDAKISSQILDATVPDPVPVCAAPFPLLSSVSDGAAKFPDTVPVSDVVLVDSNPATSVPVVSSIGTGGEEEFVGPNLVLELSPVQAADVVSVLLNKVTEENLLNRVEQPVHVGSKEDPNNTPQMDTTESSQSACKKAPMAQKNDFSLVEIAALEISSARDEIVQTQAILQTQALLSTQEQPEMDSAPNTYGPGTDTALKPKNGDKIKEVHGEASWSITQEQMAVKENSLIDIHVQEEDGEGEFIKVQSKNRSHGRGRGRSRGRGRGHIRDQDWIAPSESCWF